MRHLILLLAGLLGALLTALFLYWFWTETGPYALIAAFSYRKLGQTVADFERWKQWAMLIAYLVSAGICVTAAGGLHTLLLPKDASVVEDRTLTAFAVGALKVLVLALLAILLAAIHGLSHRASVDVPVSSITGKAGWMRDNVRIDAALWDRAGTALTATSNLGSSYSEQYVPIQLDSSENPQGLTVFVRTGKHDFAQIMADAQLRKAAIEGSLGYQPLTARTRRVLQLNGLPAPAMAVVIEQDVGAFGYWFAYLVVPLILLLLLLAAWVYGNYSERRGKVVS